MKAPIAALLLALASTAHAQDYPQSLQIGPADPILGGTLIILRETAEPGASAEVYFYNADVNDPGDQGDYTLQLDVLIVTVRFYHNNSPGGADSIEVIPPPGYYAHPSMLTRMEGYGEAVFIYPLGMS